jgi:hypothetical protein
LRADLPGQRIVARGSPGTNRRGAAESGIARHDYARSLASKAVRLMLKPGAADQFEMIEQFILKLTEARNA